MAVCGFILGKHICRMYSKALGKIAPMTFNDASHPSHSKLHVFEFLLCSWEAA